MKAALAALALVAATPAWADDDPRFCPSRPSLVDTPCTVEPGHVLVEIGAVDWTLDQQAGSREDIVRIGDVQARFGIAAHADLQLGWTAYGHDRLRDASGVSAADGVGDVRVALRRNLLHPDGKGVSFALEPYVTAPVGGRAIGAGDWGFGVLLPANLDLSDKLSFQFTGSLDAAVDQDRSGRHFSYSGDWGLGFDISERLTTVAEVQVVADDDPAGPTTQSTAALSLAYQPSKRTQLDVLIGTGLNRDTPDLQLAFGGAILF